MAAAHDTSPTFVTLLAMMTALTLACAACSSPESRTCEADSDCFVDERCVADICQFNPPDDLDTDLDATEPDADTESDADADTESDADAEQPDTDAPDADTDDTDAALTCEEGLSPCEGSCVDVQTNLNFCGSCTNPCTEDEECVVGACEPRLEPAPIGAIGVGGSNDAGRGISLAIDSRGRPHISYQNRNDQSIAYVWWTGEDWESTTVAQNDGDTQTLIAIGTDGVPHIAYLAPVQSSSDTEIRLLSFDDENWNNDLVLTRGDGAGSAGTFSLALNSENLPRIAYYEPIGNSLQLTERDIHGQWTQMDVDTTSSSGTHLALIVDAEDRSHIAYRRSANSSLRYATRPAGGSWSTRLIDDAYNAGTAASIALDANGRPHIAARAARPEGIVYARQIRDDAWDILHKSQEESIGFDPTSLAVNTENVAYIGFDSGLGAKLYAVDGNDWSLSFDQRSSITNRTAIAIDADDTVHLVYELPGGGRYYHRGP